MSSGYPTSVSIFVIHISDALSLRPTQATSGSNTSTGAAVGLGLFFGVREVCGVGDVLLGESLSLALCMISRPEDDRSSCVRCRVSDCDSAAMEAIDGLLVRDRIAGVIGAGVPGALKPSRLASSVMGDSDPSGYASAGLYGT